MALAIIGSGFGRTGTMSLKRALEELGYGPCHHMEEVFAHPEQVPYWQALAAGRPMNWDEVFAGYNSQVDWPGAQVWRETAAAYPEAKVIHTMRPEEVWWGSFSTTIGKLMDEYRNMPLPPHGRDMMDAWMVFAGRKPSAVGTRIRTLRSPPIAAAPKRCAPRLRRSACWCSTSPTAGSRCASFLATTFPRRPFRTRMRTKTSGNWSRAKRAELALRRSAARGGERRRSFPEQQLRGSSSSFRDGCCASGRVRRKFVHRVLLAVGAAQESLRHPYMQRVSALTG